VCFATLPSSRQATRRSCGTDLLVSDMDRPDRVSTMG
jgi:hypothetical protein